MSVRGTENYVYYTDQVLGSGSTATVFFARHKRKGDACAIKVFSNQDTEKKVTVKLNELEFMKKLSHPNVVTCLAVENDSRSGETALVMELCSHGSLQKMLTEPQYFHGLPEPLYVQFVGQLSSGLHYLRLHGISHRDIKPGNILCSREDDGSMSFKLTDFGASRDLVTDTAKSSVLYGTEEFLHPLIYNAVFINKQPIRDEYELCAELWAIGVTLYQTACGQLPFQPWGGRKNKETMYTITSKKPPKAISGVQRSANAQVEYSENFPPSCALSQGVRQHVVPLIAGLMEWDLPKQLQFDVYFPSSNLLQISTVIVTLHVVRGTFLRCYLRPDLCYQDLQIDLGRQMKTLYPREPPHGAFRLYIGHRRLLDVVAETDPFHKYPATSESNPILILPSDRRMRGTFDDLQVSGLVPAPVCESADKAVEAAWARDVCAYAWRAIAVTQSLVQVHVNTAALRQTLVEVKTRELDTCRNSLADSVALFAQLLPDSTLLAAKTNVVLRDLAAAFAKERSALAMTKNLLKKSLAKFPAGATVTDAAAAESQLSRLEARFRERLAGIATRLAEAREQKGKIEGGIAQEIRPPPGGRLEPLSASPCEAERCVEKLVIHREKATVVHQQFLIDKKEQLTYNQEQLHKFEKMKLEERLMNMRLRNMEAINESHCLPATQFVLRQFLAWHREQFMNAADAVRRLEREVELFGGNLRSIHADIDKLSRDCDEVRKWVDSGRVIESLKAWKERPEQSGEATGAGSGSGGTLTTILGSVAMATKPLGTAAASVSKGYEMLKKEVLMGQQEVESLFAEQDVTQQLYDRLGVSRHHIGAIAALTEAAGDETGVT